MVPAQCLMTITPRWQRKPEVIGNADQSWKGLLLYPWPGGLLLETEGTLARLDMIGKPDCENESRIVARIAEAANCNHGGEEKRVGPDTCNVVAGIEKG